MGRPHSDVSLQVLENTALSWGIILKSACILTEITIRKSHPLALQRYLMKYLVKAPFPVGEIRPMLALLHPGHKPQDGIRLEDFEG
jgi:hypothetical protein